MVSLSMTILPRSDVASNTSLCPMLAASGGPAGAADDARDGGGGLGLEEEMTTVLQIASTVKKSLTVGSESLQDRPGSSSVFFSWTN